MAYWLGFLFREAKLPLEDVCSSRGFFEGGAFPERVVDVSALRQGPINERGRPAFGDAGQALDSFFEGSLHGQYW